MPRTQKPVRAYTPVRVSFEQRMAAERLFLTDPRRWRSPTHVLRFAAHNGLPVVCSSDVGAAHATRRRRGVSHSIGFWPETIDLAKDRDSLGGTVACRIIAAIDHGLALASLVKPTTPEYAVRAMPPWIAATDVR